MKCISEQIADWLIEQGIDTVFTVTGGGAMFLNQYIAGHPLFRTIFMHHEQACAMAAEGYARISGKPALVMLTTGPGAINALNGVFGAYTDSIPMLIISGQVKRETCVEFYSPSTLRQLGDQEGPTIALARNICKYARLIREPRDLEKALPEALSASMYGRPGPAWIDVPLDIQSSNEKLHFFPLAKEYHSDSTLLMHCSTLISLLLEADRPLILGGTGVRLAGVTQQLLRLIEKTGIPLATAWTHDLIASNHPLYAGRPGTIGTRAGNFCLQSADFVLVLGSRLNVRQTSYNFDSFARDAWVVQVDIDPAELLKPTIQPDLGIVADLKNFLDVFEDKLKHVTMPSWDSWATWCHSIGVRYNTISAHNQVDSKLLNPYILIDRIFNQLNDYDIIVCGNASACILPFQVGNLKPGQRMFSNSGAASMGYDLPSALGAAVAANPGRRVICIAGDGSLQMNVQELQTLKTINANVIIIVIKNNGYLSIRQTHENFFGRVIGATPETGVDFPDFYKVALAYGIRALQVSTPEQLKEAEAWLNGDGPLLLEFVVDPKQEFNPRIKSRVDELGKFISPELDDMYPFLPKSELMEVRDSALKIRSSFHQIRYAND